MADFQALSDTSSGDDGRTWPISKTVDAGFGAYCDMVAGENGMIYVVYETGKKKEYEKIGLARFNLDWLADGKDEIKQDK
ncbi:MAG: exo-alpha-sialidase [Pirellulales bacterium]|nr:exo-alpha-sialidase [Pirellulales bacterium]